MKKLSVVVILTSVGIFVLPRFGESGTIRVPADYPTIEAGINAASSGDTVLVAAGTYHENDIRMKAGVVIKGAGIDLSIVDGDGKTVFWGADDATLEGFTITNASRSSEYGIICFSTTTISNNKIINCYIGITVYDNAIIKNNIFFNNSDYGIFCGDKSPLITHNLIVDSDGAIVSVSSDLIAYNNTIHKNSRGLWIQKSPSDTTAVVVTATNNIFSSNSWYGVFLASGSYGVDPAYITITYNDVWNNSPNYSSNWFPEPSDISQDPLFVNPGPSERSLGKLSLVEIAKIIEKNEIQKANDIAQYEEFLKLGRKKINVKNIVVNNEFMSLTQIDPSDYYLQTGSPCIDAGDPNSPLDPDGTRADMGAFYYNQSNAVDPTKTTVVADPDTIPADGLSTSTITVTPKDSQGNNLGAVQNVVLGTTAGILLGTVSDTADGTYTQELQSSNTPGTAIITATVNGIEMDQKPQVVFIPTAGVAVRIDPPQVDKVNGDTFTVNVVIDSVTNLGSFQFDIEYGTSVVYADSAWLGSFLGSTARSASPVGPTIDNSSDTGKVTFGGFSFGTAAGPDGSGVLAIVRFTAQDTGSSILDLKNVQATDINGQKDSLVVIGDGHVKVGVMPPEVDPVNTTVLADPDTIAADGESTSMIIVIPKDALNKNIGSGQTVVLATTAGTLLNTASDNSDGTYTQELQSAPTTGTATIIATVNGIVMNQKPVVVFDKPVGINDNVRKNIPEEFLLSQNYPNPFNPETTIEYQIPKRSRVTIKIYNLMGQEIVTLVEQDKEAGYFKTIWDGKDSFGKQVASGIYLYEMRAGEFITSKKLAFIR